MFYSKTTIYLLLLALLGLSACGGGGGGGGGGGDLASAGDSGGGIGGTGVTSTGTVDGLGSIFVNGVEFETDSAEVFLDGRASSEDEIRVGMVVTVTGTVNDDGVTGTATRVVFDDEVQGPIATIQTGLDGDSLLLDVLGVAVIVERTGTVFDDVNFDTLAVDDVIEVSGFFDDQLRLRATRVEKKSAFIAGSSEIELKGQVAGLTATQFSIGNYIVDYSNADLSDIAGGEIKSGMRVEVRGTVSGFSILADRVEQEDEISDGFEDDDQVSVQGAITNFTNAAQFAVNGVAIDASNASLLPADLLLANGLIVQVEGRWDGSVLQASTIESRRGRIEIEASVTAVSVTDGSITVRLFPGTLSVQVDARTLLDDDTDQKQFLGLADIAVADFLEIEALLVSDTLVATRIDRDDPDDDILQAPVDGFTAGLDITLLGVTYSTAGAKFEGANGGSLTGEAFFAQLQIGDLVKVTDEQPADGIADEVEFERADGLDGDDEFDDDSSDSDSDDSSDSDSSSDDSSGSGSDDSSDNDSDDNSDSDSSSDDSSGSSSDDSSASDSDDSSGSDSSSDDSSASDSDDSSGSGSGSDDSSGSGSSGSAD